jgi:hypothetical protein
MSSALTGNKIKDSYQALLKMGTNGSLDPNTLITISDGLGNDTPLQLSGDKLATNYLGNTQGLFMDFVNDDYQFGDINGNTAYLSIGINGSSLFGNDVASLESSNKQVIVNNGLNQLIYTSNDNGTYSDDRGFKLDFANNLYQFGDWDGIAFDGKLNISGGGSELNSEGNYLGLYGPSLNTVLGYLPGSMYLNNPSANSNNYVFGSDWYMDNNDDTSYPFKYNTVLNCYNNNLNTSDKAMKYNFFANIQDPGFTLQCDPNIQDKEAITNCFMFGLTNLNGSNTFKIVTPDINNTNTNVVILNGSGLSYGEKVTNIFSVNASLVNINDGSSGITILGGDYFRDGVGYVTARHFIEGKNIYGVNIKGRYAIPMNPYSDVTAEYFPDENTIQGQVQVEQFQLYRFYDDGSVGDKLNKSNGNPSIELRNSSSYRVNLKLVSTTGDGDLTTSGNSSLDINWLVCVNASGNVTASSPCEGCKFDDAHATGYDLGTSQNKIEFGVTPDSLNGNQCWVKGLVTLNLVTTN